MPTPASIIKEAEEKLFRHLCPSEACEGGCRQHPGCCPILKAERKERHEPIMRKLQA